MNNPALLIRLLFQRLKAPDGGNLHQLVPRALADHEILPGKAELAVVDADELPGGGWCSAGLLIPRAYNGYVAVHYAQNTDQHETFPDEANIFRTLVAYAERPDVQGTPGYRSFGQTPARWFLNTEPSKANLPPVLTLTFEWRLEVDITVQETP